jgi:heme/copper-type cytochrome/quinol oxidase subunit 3
MKTADDQWRRVATRFYSSRTFVTAARIVLLASTVVLAAAAVFLPEQRTLFFAAAVATSVLLGISQLFWRQIREFEKAFRNELEKGDPPSGAV